MNHLLTYWSNQGLHHVFRSKVPEREPQPASRTLAKHAPASGKPAHARATPTKAASQPALPRVSPAAFEWEKPWSIWQKKITRGARFVFTYEELSEDLGGQSNPARSAFWRTLLGELKWPKGTVSFWPCSDFPGQTLNPGYFWRGVQLIKPRIVVFFGSNLRDNLLPASEQFYQNGWPGLSLALSGPGALIADQEAGLKAALETLSSIFP